MVSQRIMDRNTVQPSDPPSAVPAPYGHSCAECSHSKCKCVIRGNEGVCERCHRFGKDCRPSATVRRRNPKKQKSFAPYTPSSTSRSERGSVTSAVDDRPQNLALSAAEGSSSEETFDNEPSGFEAEQYLSFFYTYKAKYFPFVYIPPTTTAQQLRHDRPILWLCIMTVASRSTPQQQVLGRKIRDTLAQEMMLKSGQTIDLLLGLLTYIGWSNYQIHSKPSLSVFTQLAVSLVYDLGLNRPVPRDNPLVALCIQSHNTPMIPTPRTMEERRAVLGCFLVTSIVSSFLQKIDALRWTPHLDECLEVLNEKHESPIDDILVQQVRMQLIVEKVTRGPWNDGAIKTAEHSNVPLCFYLNALQSQLQEVKSKIPPYLKDNEIVLAHFYSTQLTINETVLSSLPSSNNQADFQPVERLYACIESVKSWFEIFFTIPPIAYVGFPFSIFSQLVRCLSTLYRLSTLEDPAWERKSVQKTADLLVIFDQVIKNMEQVAAIAGQDNNGSTGEDTFSRTAKMFRSIRPGWEAKLGGLDSETVSTLPTLPVGTDIPLPEVTLTEPMDKDWLMDLFLPPNYQFQ